MVVPHEIRGTFGGGGIEPLGVWVDGLVAEVWGWAGVEEVSPLPTPPILFYWDACAPPLDCVRFGRIPLPRELAWFELNLKKRMKKISKRRMRATQHLK